ncbi:MAG: tRNA A-37 threonylcarbamoyl transferase component Bud32 [Polyangiales bacterium]|jgi:tRNA A-37 threonylcarbamoyl transferase component Bud32
MRPPANTSPSFNARPGQTTMGREVLCTFSPLVIFTLLLAGAIYAAFSHLGNAADELAEREYQNQQGLIARQAAERLADVLDAVQRELDMSSVPPDLSDFELPNAPVKVTVLTLEAGAADSTGLTVERQVAGVRLRAQLDAESVYEALFAGLGQNFDAYVWVMDDERTIMATPDSDQVGTRPFESTPDESRLSEVLRAMVAGESGVGRYEWRGENRTRTRLIAYTPVREHSLSVAYSADRAAVLALTQELHTRQAWWLALFLGGLFISSSVLILRAVRRYRERLEAMSRLGPYALGQQLGEGGMGVVFEANHALLRRPTAIKLIHAELSTPSMLQRFEREVQMTARLTHPNTVTVFDYGQTAAGVFYYAMELVDGPTLRQVIEHQGRLPEARVVHLMKQVAGALAEAHELGLIHRDIKPSNIMLCKRGGLFDIAKVLDFGLVRVVGETGGKVVGTPAYMAPETFTSASNVGERSDVYALGAVAYYLVTGEDVFDGATITELASQHTLDAPRPPGERIPKDCIHASFEAVILRCLEKEPNKRPASARELLAELENLESEWSQADAEALWFSRPPPGAVGSESPTELGFAQTREVIP